MRSSLSKFRIDMNCAADSRYGSFRSFFMYMRKRCGVCTGAFECINIELATARRKFEEDYLSIHKMAKMFH